MSMTHACVVALLVAGSAAMPAAQSPPPAPTSIDDTARLARTLLAEELKVPVESVTVAEQRERVWPDAQFGCVPRKGVFEVEPVATPGYELQLVQAGRRYEVRADKAGHVRRCAAVPGSPPRDGPAGPPRKRG